MNGWSKLGIVDASYANAENAVDASSEMGTEADGDHSPRGVEYVEELLECPAGEAIVDPKVGSGVLE